MKALIFLLLVLAAAPSSRAAAAPVPLSGEQLAWLGGRIFSNECDSRTACLTSWNAGEDFPSLGIGHFIWYRRGQTEAFTESFPELLAFLEAHGAPPPAWIRAGGHEAPWQSREAFQAALDSAPMRELRDYLRDTMALQTAFILRRFEQALAAMLEAAPAESRALIEGGFQAVAGASPPHGLYALVDYLNFKGEGTSPLERYRGQGWGLRQVLEAMPADGAEPLADFVAAARQVLSRRVRNAPPERNETRWLAGWHKRLDTYLPPSPE